MFLVAHYHWKAKDFGNITYLMLMFDLPTPPPPWNGLIVRSHLNLAHCFAIFLCSLDNLVGKLTIQIQKQRMSIKAKHRTWCRYDRNMCKILWIWAISMFAVFSRAFCFWGIRQKNKIVNSIWSHKKVFAINFIIGSRKLSQYAHFFQILDLCEAIIIFHVWSKL